MLILFEFYLIILLRRFNDKLIMQAHFYLKEKHSTGFIHFQAAGYKEDGCYPDHNELATMKVNSIPFSGPH